MVNLNGLEVCSVWAGWGCPHLIAGKRGVVMVDAGWPGHEQRILQAVQAWGRGDLCLIYITHGHFDHYGSAAALRRLTGAPIAIHRADAEAMACGQTNLGSARNGGQIGAWFLPLVERWRPPEPTPPDVLLTDGESLEAFGLEGIAVHTPGHTPGSSCLLVERRIAFAGDLISRTGIPHAQQLYADDWTAVAESVQRLQNLGPEWTYAGHGRRPVSKAVLTGLDAG